MKLILKKLRKPTMTSLVVVNPKGGSVMWAKIGDIQEVNDAEFCYKLLSEHSDMLFEYIDDVVETKAAESPQNKSMDSKISKTK